MPGSFSCGPGAVSRKWCTVRTMKIDVQTLNFIVGFGIPLLTGALTKVQASSRVKSLVNLVLTALSAVIVLQVKEGEPFVSANVFLNGFLRTFVSSAASYYGLWKPTGTAPAVANATSGVGVG